MLVRNNALVMGVDDPNPILAALPNAKLLNFKGRNIVAVRHSIDAAKVLINLGLDAPSPILHGNNYSFPGMYTPMEQQYITAAFFTLHNRAYCFNEMRTGKTSAALWAADYLANEGKVKRVLVVSPLSVVDVWSDEAFKTITHRSVTQLLGSRERKMKLAKEQTLFSLINFDGLSSLYHEEYYPGKQKRIKRKWSDLEGMFDLIIVDEADAYCNAQNLRWRALEQLIKADTKVWMLTGTPTPNAPTDSYGLIRLMHRERVPHSYTLYEEQLMRPAGPYKKVPREGAVDAAFALMQPAIRFKRAQCADLPTTISNRSCTMSKEQQKVFDDLKNKMRHEDESGETEITAVNAAVKLIKLQQVMCGAVKDDDGNPVELNPHSRLKEVEELIRQAGSKTVVFVPFIHSMHMIANYLESKGFKCAIMNGNVKKAERTKILRAFARNAHPDVLIAHPKVVSHGVDCTAADTFIWYGPTFSTGQYEQANARGEGPKKTLATGIYHIGCHPVEWAIYDALKSKINMQGSLLDLYREVVY